MKTGSVIAAFVIGVILGLWIASRQAATVSSATHAQALSDLARVRDSVTVLRAVNVRVDTLQVPHTVMSTRWDTVVVRDTFMDYRVRTIKDTVLVRVNEGDASRFAWDFGDTTAAFTLTGTAHANCVSPQASFVGYTLDVHRRAICPKEYRFMVGAGYAAGNPYITGMMRLKRWWIGPVVADDDNGTRFGVMAARGVF